MQTPAVAKTAFVAPSVAAILVLGYVLALYKPSIVDVLALVPGKYVCWAVVAQVIMAQHKLCTKHHTVWYHKSGA